ncbi:14 kDa proline-rich protein DC2.15-like [Hibiscus syriacus]|uniref:14 kDa proline-rich protein DC2.15-like n=1 Tax=Hibiscus syriacus TaxID=106335 RepID=UPI001920CB93|nr:14 kDa proline-rich protein DC2.15-like [Hibiscus syriacus]
MNAKLHRVLLICVGPALMLKFEDDIVSSSHWKPLLFSSLSTLYPCPPTPKSPRPPSSAVYCPRDALKLGVCANLLNDLVHVFVGTPPKSPCCPLLGSLADLEAAVCLCTDITANVLGINLNVPLSLSLVLNYCGKGVPKGFQCA